MKKKKKRSFLGTKFPTFLSLKLTFSMRPLGKTGTGYHSIPDIPFVTFIRRRIKV